MQQKEDVSPSAVSIVAFWLLVKATAKPKPDADFADVTRINHREEWKDRVIGTTCGSGWCFGFCFGRVPEPFSLSFSLTSHSEGALLSALFGGLGSEDVSGPSVGIRRSHEAKDVTKLVSQTVSRPFTMPLAHTAFA